MLLPRMMYLFVQEGSHKLVHLSIVLRKCVLPCLITCSAKAQAKSEDKVAKKLDKRFTAKYGE
jgi:hypothetical protein